MLNLQSFKSVFTDLEFIYLIFYLLNYYLLLHWKYYTETKFERILNEEQRKCKKLQQKIYVLS